MTAPIRLRYRAHDVDADQGSPVGKLRPQITRDLVADITAVLASGLTLRLGENEPRPVDRPIWPCWSARTSAAKPSGRPWWRPAYRR